MDQDDSPTPNRRTGVGQLVVNVLANYGYYVVGMGVTFVLNPFLNGHLGKSVCGDWFFLIGLTLYFSLADAGFNAATVKYVAEHIARREWAEAGRIMAASLRFFLFLSGLFAALGLGVWLIPHYLVFPAILVNELKAISTGTGFTILSVLFFNWAIEMAFAPFNAALFGAQRYELARGVAILARLARFTAVLVLISLGCGVVTLALVTAGEALLRGSLQTLLVRRRFPELPLGLANAEWATYRKFIRFSAWILVSNLAYKLIMVTDVVLVQFCREEAEVVLYNSAMIPIIGMEQLLWAIAQVIVPFAAAGAALAQRRTLQQTILRGARFTLLIALPMVTYLCLAGRGFFGGWMFNEKDFPLAHVTEAQHLVWLLAPAFILLFLQQPAIAVLVGSGRVRAPALINLGQGVTKIALSLILVRHLGLTGIALGTVIPLVIANAVVLPWFVKRELGVGWSAVLRHTVRPALVTFLIAGPLAYGWLRLVHANDPTLWRLRFQIPIALGVALIFGVTAWFVGLHREDRGWVRARWPWRRQPGPTHRSG